VPRVLIAADVASDPGPAVRLLAEARRDGQEFGLAWPRAVDRVLGSVAGDDRDEWAAVFGELEPIWRAAYARRLRVRAPLSADLVEDPDAVAGRLVICA
jgi:hypothetical protein